MRESSSPPVDLDAVRGVLHALLADGRHDELITLVLDLLRGLRDRNTALELDKARLLRKHLQQTSERMSPAQLSLLFSLLGEDAQPSPETPMTSAEAQLSDTPADEGTKKRRGGGRKPLPEHLPRIEVEHRVPDEARACPHCGGERTCIGHETSEVLEFVPASWRVEVHKREKLACRACETGVVSAPVADKAIAKGRPGPGLLAHVIVSKFADHLPLNRQHKMFLRDGVDLPSTTLMDWVKAVHEALEPVAARIGELALDAHVLQSDDIGIKVLDRDEPKGAKRGHLWCYAGDQTWAVFRYTPDWRKEGPQSYLARRRGWLVADAYKGYDGLFTRADATAVEVGCWAHARRYFFELAEVGDARVAPVLDLVRRLYVVEARATEDGVDADERLARRIAESAPLLDELGAWCARIYNAEPPASDLARAIRYVVNQWTALRRFLEDGRLPIDNTLVERRLRPIAVGRHNYLFCGSDAGGERAATMYTLIATCALVGAEPRAYVTDVLRKLAHGHPWRLLDDLLPPNWIATAHARVAPSR